MNLKTFVKTKVIIEKSHFYGTEIDIRAGFGPVGITEKKHIWANYEQLLRLVFSSFYGQKRNK